LCENYFHIKSLNNIPIRIHVNGTRGKSSVTRLIAAGLREAKIKTFGKTTGTTPRIINDKGNDVELHRLRSASIGEQIKLIRYFSKKNPDALVMECMAVNPQYQWVSEHKIVKSTLGVITNVRPDHLDEMGSSNKEIALSLSNTIPFNSQVITAENINLEPLDRIAKNRHSKLIISKLSDVDDKYISSFPFVEHPENIALALKVCMALGVDKYTALKGMKKTKPDPGALFIWNIKYNLNRCRFISGFAANDPSSTMMVWNLIKHRFKGLKSCIFLNTRNDRRYRTIQLISLVMKDIKPDFFILRGDNITNVIDRYAFDKKSIKLFDMSATEDDVIQEILQLDQYYILGIGNIVGWGENFVKKIKDYI